LYFLSLLGLVFLLLLVAECAPHFAQLFADPTKGQVRVILLDLGTMLLAKKHESSESLLGLLLASTSLLGRSLLHSCEESDRRTGEGRT
jgi:hypothetical protein